jgi:murein DD-endopeptidase MepM/ murein hydrolase activator NlpD
VKRGQPLGKCGNSGNSDYPHVHLHVQDTPVLNAGRAHNPEFGPVNVELTGKQFERVTWPMIRGLFVSNP